MALSYCCPDQHTQAGTLHGVVWYVFATTTTTTTTATTTTTSTTSTTTSTSSTTTTAATTTFHTSAVEDADPRGI